MLQTLSELALSARVMGTEMHIRIIRVYRVLRVSACLGALPPKMAHDPRQPRPVSLQQRFGKEGASRPRPLPVRLSSGGGEHITYMVRYVKVYVQ